MSNQACRDYAKAKGLPRDKASHAGLLLDCYLNVPVKERAQGDESGHPDDRLDLLKNAQGACNSARSLYERAFDRYEADVMQRSGKSWSYYQTKSRIAINLSQASVLETSVALHHTYGVPYIPATALKGLTSHYCHTVLGRENDALSKSGAYYKTLFGTEEDRGHILFHDAWIQPESIANGLSRDVMTPHHADYYGGKGAPTDFDNPNPITYLTIMGKFLIHIDCDVSGEQGDKWTAYAQQLLRAALEHWGVGGKTNAGYGVMIKDGDENKKALRQDKERREEIITRERQDKERAEKEARIAKLPEFERTICQQMLKDKPDGQKESTFILGQLKTGAWQGEDKIRAAKLIQSYMEEEKIWVQESRSKNPKKDKKHQNTLFVLGCIESKK